MSFYGHPLNLFLVKSHLLCSCHYKKYTAVYCIRLEGNNLEKYLYIFVDQDPHPQTTSQFKV